MSRIARGLGDSLIYHVLNRENGRHEVFHKEQDYKVLIDLMREAKNKGPLKIFSYCVIANHFHIILQLTQERY